MAQAHIPLVFMYFAKAFAITLIAFIVVSCSQNPPRHVELHLPVPQTAAKPSSVATPDKTSQHNKALLAQQEKMDIPTTEEWHPVNLWDRIRAGFQLSDYTPDTLPKTLSWYKQRQYHMDRVVEQSAPYLHFVLEEVEKRGMPTEIALLPVVESDYKPFALSHSGAAGIWQFIPTTGEHYGLKQDEWYDGRRDIHASTRAALDFLQDLYKRLDNDWLLALAAYNSGGSTVERAIRRAKKNGKSGNFWSIRPLLPEETRHYIPKLLAISAMVMDPEFYDISLKKIPNEPHLTRLQINSRISLAVAARLAQLPIDEFRQLNPGFTRLVTPPNGPHDLLLPIDKAARFKWSLSQLSSSERIGWIYHTVAAGESLSVIAAKYGTTTAALKQSNNIRGNTIRIGEKLQILLTENSILQNISSQSLLSQNTPSTNKSVTHTVANGETLWSVARRYRVTITQLARWNAIPTAKPLMPGQKLVIRPRNNT